MTWEALRDVIAMMEQEAQVFANNVPGILNSGENIGQRKPRTPAVAPCPGDCPPATVDIFCQPHPDQALYPGKVIAKFSSIDEKTLNGIGFTEAHVQSFG